LSPTSDSTRHRQDLDRHVVTAVLVTHDGARWLPGTLKALLTQTRPVQRLVAADTGSTDRGPAVMAEVIGAGNLVTLPRTTGYGEAVNEALRHPAATMAVPEAAELAHSRQVEWIWLLHDDSAPAATALEQLLAVADENPHVGILGPKLRDWYDERLLLEMGVTMDAAGRRDTGIDRREFDQGQHDGVKDVLAVSTAGMLIRRDVWDELDGFDVRLGLFRDDIDLGWRAHTAGHRVFAVSDAVVYHAEAAARRQRPIGLTSDDARRIDRRNALYVLLANVPFGVMLRTLVRNIFVSLVRTSALLIMKQPDAARSEMAALGDVLRDIGGLRRMRADRANGRTHAYRSIRRFQPRGLALRRLIDALGNRLSGTGPVDSAGRHHAFGDEGEEEEPLVPESRRWARRLFARPGVVTVLLLGAVTVAAGRSLITSGGRLGGGALVPAWGGASDLWAQYLTGWHPIGLGSAGGSPPAVGVLAALSTVLLGKPWLAVMALLLGCVPLAGLTAYIAARRIVPDAPPPAGPARPYGPRLQVPAPVIRSWAAVTYALLPVATGAVSAGRIGTAVVMVLLPLIGLQAIQILNPRGPDRVRRAGRAAWATALLLAVAMAFMPLAWVLAVIVGTLIWTAYGPTVPGGRRGARAAGQGATATVLRRNLLIALIVPPLLLLPWVIGLFLHPSRFLLEIGLNRAEIVDERLPALSILALNPGGPGTPELWTTAGLLALGLGALLLRQRRAAVLGGWMLALFGLLIAVLASAVTVTKGADTAVAWPGVPLAFAAAGVLVAAIVIVQRAMAALAGRRLLPRVAGALMLVAALSTPVLAAAAWVAAGGRGPLAAVDEDAIPAFVGVTGDAAVQPRMLVLNRQADGTVSYSVLRGAVPTLGESEIFTTDAAQARLDSLVAGLLAGRGNAESRGLTRMGVHYLLVPDPGRDPLTKVLDSAPEVTRLSRTEGFALWRLATPGGRLMLVDGNQITPLPVGRIDAQVRVPPGGPGRTLLLAEPADDGWRATLNGAAPRAKQVDGWAQAWDVPPTGGEFTLTRGMLTRHIWLGVQLAAVLVVVALALPGRRAEEPGAEPRHARSRRRRGPADELPASDELAESAEPPEPVLGVESGAPPPWTPGTAEPMIPADPAAEPVREPVAQQAREPAAEPGSRRRGRGTRRRRSARRLRLPRRLRRSGPGDKPEADKPEGGEPAAAGPAGAEGQPHEVAALGGPEAGDQ
jgi:GT2 family glycosyltransferase